MTDQGREVLMGRVKVERKGAPIIKAVQEEDPLFNKLRALRK